MLDDRNEAPPRPARPAHLAKPVGAAPARPRSIGRAVLDRIASLIFDYPTDSWEFASGLLLTVWGGWVMVSPDEMFTLEMYAYFHKSFAWVSGFGIATNEAVGFLCLLSGVFAFVSLFIARFGAARVWASGVAACTWASVLTGFVKYDWALTGTPVYGTFCLLSSLVFMRLALARQQALASGEIGEEEGAA